MDRKRLLAWMAAKRTAAERRLPMMASDYVRCGFNACLSLTPCVENIASMAFHRCRSTTFARALVALAALLFTVGLARAQQVTIDFQGLQNSEKVRDYYAGGHGSLGSGPGPNYGVTFGPDANSVISTTVAAGQTVLFTNNPNASAPAPTTMNVAGGFSGQLSFQYATADPL